MMIPQGVALSCSEGRLLILHSINAGGEPLPEAMSAPEGLPIFLELHSLRAQQRNTSRCSTYVETFKR